VQGKPRDAAPFTAGNVLPVGWSLAPLGEAELLSAVRLPDGRYFFRDFRLTPGQAPGSRGEPRELVQFPEGVPQQPALTFCSPAEGGKTRIVAAGAGKIWAASVEETKAGAWQPVGDAAEPSFLHAFSPRGRTCWVEWFEKDVGLRRAPLP
jgi:hypothetical protein